MGIEEETSLVKAMRKVLEQLKLINGKLDSLVEANIKLAQTLEKANKLPLDPQADVLTLLKLPGSMRDTAMALYRFEKGATANDIAKVTGKLRTTESHIVNQLARQGLVKKRREGREVYFSIEPKLGAEQ